MKSTISPRMRSRSRLAARIIGLVWMLGFALWFYSFELPNNKFPDGTPITRGDIWRLLPELLLENVYPTRDAASPPSGWRFLSQRFDLLALAAVILAGAWGAGHLVLRLIGLRNRLDSLERTVFAFGLGLSGLSLLTMICGVAGMLNRWLLGGAIVAFLAGEFGCRWRTHREIRKSRVDSAAASVDDQHRHVSDRALISREFSIAGCITMACVIPFVLAMLLGAMLPSVDFDVKEYHLQGPKEFFQQGRVTFLPHNVYTSFPFLTEMLSLLAMVLRNDWFRGALAGKVVLMSFAPLTAMGLFAAGRRWFSPTVGWMAALVYVTTPWVYRYSIIAYAEGGLAFFLFASLWAVMLRQSATDVKTAVRLTLLSGLLAGSAVACKYPGIISVAMPLGAAVVMIEGLGRLRSRRAGKDEARHSEDAAQQEPASLRMGLRSAAQAAAVFALGTLITFGPWMLKNVAETGNPVYPLLYSVFGGEDWTPEMNEKWRNGHSPPVALLKQPSRIPRDLWAHVVDVVARSDWQSPLVFGLAPLALLWCGQRRLVFFLCAYGLWLFFTWWGLTHRIDRFWVPMLPLVSLLAAIGLGWLIGLSADATSPKAENRNHRSIGQRAVTAGVILTVAAAVLFNLGFVTSPLSGYNAYLIDLNHATRQAATPSIRLLNELPLPEGAKVLFVGEAQVFDARFDHVYNTVFDESIFQQWTSAAVPDVPDAEQPLRPMDEIRRTFAEHGITHVFVNWLEVARYRAPGSYGYTDFVTPARFDELVAGGVLREIPRDPSWGYQLYEVR